MKINVTVKGLEEVKEKLARLSDKQVGQAVVMAINKTTDKARRLHEARQLKALCSAHDALLIINDDVRLALECLVRVSVTARVG